MKDDILHLFYCCEILEMKNFNCLKKSERGIKKYSFRQKKAVLNYFRYTLLTTKSSFIVFE